MQAWFFVLMTVGNEPGNQMDHKIGGTPMTGMLDLRNILELVDIASMIARLREPQFI